MFQKVLNLESLLCKGIFLVIIILVINLLLTPEKLFAQGHLIDSLSIRNKIDSAFY